MGLIKAGMGAVGGVLGDQWKEFIYCDSLAADVLVTKGQKLENFMDRTACQAAVLGVTKSQTQLSD